MRLQDVVNQIRLVLPKYTSIFSDVLSISSISAAGGTATITTGVPHGLSTGASITITNCTTLTAIDSVSQSGLQFTFTTVTDHDLTLGWPDHDTVTLDGFTDAAWNGDFQLLDVQNRRTFTVKSINTIPILNGNEVLREIRIDGVNGRHQATVLDTLNFTISSSTIADGTYEGGQIGSNIRVAGSATVQRAIEQYTKQSLNDYWIFVVMDDPEVSKDRSTYSDAVSTQVNNNDMRLRLVDGFFVYIIKNTTQDIAAVQTVDTCRHDLLLPLLKTVNGAIFDTGLTYSGDFKTIMLGHSVFDYNRAFLIYEYRFQSVMDLTDDDVVERDDTRAFRNIDYSLGVGSQEMTVNDINLDDHPL